jgi:hypothetical protein
MASDKTLVFVVRQHSYRGANNRINGNQKHAAKCCGCVARPTPP